MDVLGIIPARGGSKGIPRKNIKLLADKPLIAYTIEAAKQSSLTHYVVSTEDPEIAEIAKSFGAPVIQRPPDLAADGTPTLPVIQHALREVGFAFDSVMTLQPTSPLRTHIHINEAISLFEDNPKADSLVSVVQVPHNMSPVSIMELKGGYLSTYLTQEDQILRRQEKPVFYARNGAAIYLTRTKNLDNYIFGGSILAYKMEKEASLDIDDECDWMLMELIMKNELVLK